VVGRGRLRHPDMGTDTMSGYTDRERLTSNVQLSTFNGVTERARAGRDMGTGTEFGRQAALVSATPGWETLGLREEIDLFRVRPNFAFGGCLGQRGLARVGLLPPSLGFRVCGHLFHVRVEVIAGVFEVCE